MPEDHELIMVTIVTVEAAPEDTCCVLCGDPAHLSVGVEWIDEPFRKQGKILTCLECLKLEREAGRLLHA